MKKFRSRWPLQLNTNRHRLWIVSLLTLLGTSPVLAQSQTADGPHAGHEMPAAIAEDEHAGHEMPAAVAEDEHAGHDMSVVTASEHDHDGADNMASMNMESMDMAPMQGGKAPANARDPHAYAEGQDFGPFSLHLADTKSFAYLLVENFELSRSNGNTSGGYDLQGWYGRIYDRVVFKAEGDVADGRLEESRSELLWGHAIASYWDSQIGVRIDTGDGLNRSWLAFGVQGLAPYWFELDATAYLGESGRSAFRLDASYELMLTQRLILQPRLEADFYGKDDTARGLGSGLAEVSTQLRLRYLIRREFAPYLGIERIQKFGDTRNLARGAGEDTSDVRFVAGLRVWF